MQAYSPTQPQKFEIRFWHIMLGVIGLMLYMYAFNVPPKMNGEELLFWGYMHIGLHGLCMALYFLKGVKKSSYPFIPYFCFFQLLGLGIPIFLINKNKFLFSRISEASLGNMFYAYLILYSTYWFCSLFMFKKLDPFQAVKSTPTKRLELILTSFFFLIVLDYTKLIPALVQLVLIVKYVYIGLALMLMIQGKSSTWTKVTLITIMTVEILNRAVSGLIAEVAMLVLFIVVVFNICKARVLWLVPLLIPFLLFYSTFSKVKFIYRDKVWFSKKSFTLTDKLNLIYDLSKTGTTKIRRLEKEGKDNFFYRYAYPSSIFARVLRRTPEMVPYWNGETYASLFTKFIPRVLWPDKPKETLGHDFGVRYGVISKSDKVTSVNTPILVEMYINFGFEGLFIGCALFGLLILFIDRYFNSDNISIENKIINASITFSLLIIESNFSLTFGNLFLFCIVLKVMFHFAKFGLPRVRQAPLLSA